MDFPNNQSEFHFTSQSYTIGHPDKLCDYISDSVLDACLQQDSNSKVGCQCVIKNQVCMVFGEISTKAQISIEKIARNALKEANFDSIKTGIDYKLQVIIVSIDKQSPDIAQSIHLQKQEINIGAGDQGLMIGYATDQSQAFMPISQHFCNLIVRKLESQQTLKKFLWIRPYAKVFVTIIYKKQNQILVPISIDTIGIQCQSDGNLSIDQVRFILENQIIRQVIPSVWLKNTKFIVNPEGIMQIPKRIVGLTGRKIISDTYGCWGGHGGGAFSGKDSSKVDRSAGYMARWIAKSLVANKFCKRVFVQISYSIGLSNPLSILIDSYQTVLKGLSDKDLTQISYRNFDLRPGAIIQQLKLKRPIFKKTAHGGHFGRDDPQFTWEIIKDLTHQKKNYGIFQ